MFQSSFQKSMTQILEVLETRECQSSIGTTVIPVYKGTGNNSGSRSSCLDYYSVQQEEA